VRELMQSEEMQSILNAHASDIRNRAGEGFEQDSFVAGTRAVARVRADTPEAHKDNLENNTLLKAVR